MIREFLAHRGLELSEEKTFVTHLEQGFDFLGFNVRTYKGKLRIKPAEKRILRIRQKIKAVFDSNKSVDAATLIEKLNPILRGWTNYNRHCECRTTFSKLDTWIWEKLWQWACRRHGKKNAKWIKRKYFTRIGNRNWCFHGINNRGKRRILIKMSDVKFTEHVKIRSDANPFDPKDADYLARRKRRISLSKINTVSSLATGC